MLPMSKLRFVLERFDLLPIVSGLPALAWGFYSFMALSRVQPVRLDGPGLAPSQSKRGDPVHAICG